MTFISENLKKPESTNLYYMLSREEKKNKVIDMHKKEKSIREIAKAVHMSFSEIGRIIKEEFAEEQIQPTVQQSKYT